MKLLQLSRHRFFWLTALTVAALFPLGDLSGEDAAMDVLVAEDLDVELDRQKSFDQSLLPERLRKLNGKAVRVRGYLYPGSKSKDIEQFVLTTATTGRTYADTAGDTPLKCFVLVETKRGQGAKFSTRPILVEGMLRFKEYRGLDDRLWSIYWVEQATVTAAPSRKGYFNSVGRGC